MELKDTLTLAISVTSAIISVIAIMITRAQEKRHDALQLQLNQESARLQQQLTNEARKLENRRFVTTVLWDKMTSLNDINPVKPIGPDVRRALNLLESISMCWQADIVDKEMIVMSFGATFDELYQKIERIIAVPEKADGSGRGGYELLNRNRAIAVVRKEIVDQLNEQGKLTSLQSTKHA